MPIREYKAATAEHACEFCRNGFEMLESQGSAPLEKCPKCGAPVERLLSAPAVGKSKSAFDRRAQEAGFHKFKRLGRGEYEKKY